MCAQQVRRRHRTRHHAGNAHRLLVTVIPVMPDPLKHSIFCAFCKTPPNKPPSPTPSPRWECLLADMPLLFGSLEVASTIYSGTVFLISCDIYSNTAPVRECSPSELPWIAHLQSSSKTDTSGHITLFLRFLCSTSSR